MSRRLAKHWAVIAPEGFAWQGRHLRAREEDARGTRSTHRYFGTARKARNVFEHCPPGALLARYVPTRQGWLTESREK